MYIYSMYCKIHFTIIEDKNNERLCWKMNAKNFLLPFRISSKMYFSIMQIVFYVKNDINTDPPLFLDDFIKLNKRSIVLRHKSHTEQRVFLFTGKNVAWLRSFCSNFNSILISISSKMCSTLRAGFRFLKKKKRKKNLAWFIFPINMS